MIMNSNRPLISILIATKNRQKYAESAVQSILSIDDDRLELVIQDNSDTNELETRIERFKGDKRLIYRHTPTPLSFVGNFNATIEISNGEYVCLIGDDDGINPVLIEATAWAKSRGVDALVGSLSANYRWAGTGVSDTLFTKMTGGTLVISHITTRFKDIDLQASLQRLAGNGCTYYADFYFPKLYHGVVRRDYLEQIREKTGHYLGGLSPDIYASVAFACLIKRAVYVDYPLTIPGVCAESASVTEGALKKHSKILEQAPHLRYRGEYAWSKEIPRIYCVETIWADSAVAALRDMGRMDVMKKYNRYRLYAYILNANTDVGAMVRDHAKSMGMGFINTVLVTPVRVALAFVTGPFRRFWVNRLWNRLLITCRLRDLTTIRDLDDIHAAMVALTQHLSARRLTVKEFEKKS